MSEPSRLQLRAAPYVHAPRSTAAIMRDVILALAPVILMATWTFGLTAPLVFLVATLSAGATEALLGKQGWAGLKDGSVLLTGLLFGLTLPPAIPLWMVALGAVAGVGLGKTAWGGLGHNLFNPALVGRAFLQAAFPTVLTTWVAPSPGQLFQFSHSTFALPLMHGEVDVITAATPLGMAKFQQLTSPLLPLFTGDVAGSLGETSALLLLLGGLYLIWRRAMDWRIPAAVLGSVALISAGVHIIWPALPSAPAMLLSGGLMLGALFMATDPVTSPTTPLGAWIFGAGIGLLVVLIRCWGGLPEGVMYAILLMNAAAPLIERATQPRAFGRKGWRVL